MAQGSRYAGLEMRGDKVHQRFGPWKDAEDTLFTMTIRYVLKGEALASLRHSGVAFLYRLRLTVGNTSQDLAPNSQGNDEALKQ